MADDEKIEIEIVLDDGSIKKGFATISKDSKKLSDDLESNLGKSFTSIGANVAKFTAIALAAGAAIAGVIAKKSIEAASDYQTEVNRLNVALATSGQFSKEASESFLEFANTLQKTTKFSDDQVVSAGALIQTIGRLGSGELQRATTASLDLASALGIDLETAAQLVGKSANGNIAAFARYGVEIRKGSNDTETFANVLKTLESRFGGAGEAAAQTFSGSIEKAKNAFGDIFKTIGLQVVRSPAIAAAINEIAKLFSTISDSLAKSFGDKDLFKSLIINFSVIAQAGLESARQIGLSFELAALRAQQAWYAFKVLTTAGLSSSFNKQLDDINAKIDETKAKFSEESGASIFFDNLITKVTATNGKLIELSSTIVNTVAPAMTAVGISISDMSAGFVQGFTSAVDYSSAKVGDLAARSVLAKEQLTKDFVAVGQAAKQGLGNAVGSGFAAFGKALVTGENALAAFAKAMIGAIGQAAIAEGTAMILRGIGYSFDPLLAGFAPGLIGAGSALAAFGGVLSAVGGGGSSPAGGGGGAGGSVGELPASTAESGAPAIEEKSTNVKIDVGGTVLDPVGVGRQIAQILSDTFEATGTKVVTS
jgi:hypothetical protein